jgi:transposase, IS5 family
MGRRRIGQEVMGFARRERRTTLDELDGAIDWGPLEARLAAISPPGRGEPGWPPRALLKALLLGFWHDLSDVKLAEALEDRASLRRFCGFSGTEPTPERTAFVRFRRELVRLRLEKPLFAEVVRQLDARGLTVRTGALVDVEPLERHWSERQWRGVIRAASRDDGQAGWKAYGPDAPVKGYKAHVATDEAGGIVRRVVVTPANVHDATGAAGLIGRHPGRVWADAAYDSGPLKERIRRGGGTPMIVRRIDKGSRAAWNAAKQTWNATIHPVRCRIEKVFGTTKRSYGLGQARYMGRPRVSLQVHLTFILYNLRRAVTLLRPQPA